MPASSTRRTVRRAVRAALLLGIPTVLLLVALNVVLPALRSRGLERHFDQPRVIRNPLFTVYVEQDDPHGDVVEGMLRRFVDHLYEAWGGSDYLDLRSPRELESPIVVLLLKNLERLKAYHGPRYRNQSIEFNAGMYEPIAKTISLISSQVRGDSELRRGLYHEATHLALDRLARGSDHAWSLWLNEGLATYLEASVDLPGLGFQLGGVNPRHLTTALALGPVSVEEILRFKPADFRGADNARAYALCSLLVAYLLDGEAGRYRRRFWAYVAAERAPGPVSPGAFEACFGVAAKSMDGSFARALQTLFYR